mgnify:CR=1 FL=1
MDELGEKLTTLLKDQIHFQLNKQQQISTIRLDPPSLGKLEIAVQLDNGKLMVHIDQLRKSRRELSFPETPAHLDSRFEYIELISSLSPIEQEIVTLKIVGGLSHKEIGSVLGITSSAAQKRYERAISALRNKED